MTRSAILSCLGAIGVISTTIMAVSATPKAVSLLETAKEEKGEKLTKFEAVKTAGPVYIPAAIMAIATIGCIFGANILNRRSQASLASAYALLNNSYNEYKNKVEETCGEDTNKQILKEIAKDNYDESIVPSKGKDLFFDFNTMQYFESSLDEVVQKVKMDDGMECYIIATPLNESLNYPWY